MQLPETSLLTKTNAIISVIATIVYIVGFACPYWLVKDFSLHALPPILFLSVDVEANIGLVQACRVISTFLGVEEDTCSQDPDSGPPPRWHMIAVGMAIAALILAVTSCVLYVLTVVVPKLAKAHLLKLFTASLTFTVAGSIITVLVLYRENKFIQVFPPHPQQIDFDLGWAYLVTLASASAFVVLGITTFVEFLWAKTRTGSYKI